VGVGGLLPFAREHRMVVLHGEVQPDVAPAGGEMQSGREVEHRPRGVIQDAPLHPHHRLQRTAALHHQCGGARGEVGRAAGDHAPAQRGLVADRRGGRQWFELDLSGHGDLPQQVERGAGGQVEPGRAGVDAELSRRAGVDLDRCRRGETGSSVVEHQSLAAAGGKSGQITHQHPPDGSGQLTGMSAPARQHLELGGNGRARNFPQPKLRRVGQVPAPGQRHAEDGVLAAPRHAGALGDGDGERMLSRDRNGCGQRQPAHRRPQRPPPAVHGSHLRMAGCQSPRY